MIHPNPWISAFIGVPEFAWKNRLRRWLAFSPLVPARIQDYSPLKGYELLRKLQPGDHVIDAGAFPGDYALFAARRVGPGGHVYAFEPSAANRRVLERNIRLAKVTNISVIPKGLWNETATLRLTPNGLASSVQQNGGERIDVARLDDEVQRLGIPRVDVLKMDIEGAELQALAGAAETLRRHQPHTCVATYHIVDGESTAARVETLLRAAGLEATTRYPKHVTTYGCSGLTEA